MNCPRHTDEPVAENGCRRCRANAAMREYQRKRRGALKAAGKCVGTVGRSKCQNDARPGRTMCQECAGAFNKYQLDRLHERKEESPS